MEQIEGNKLIAVFMGAKCNRPNRFGTYWQFFDSKGLIRREVREDSMEYHTSWDWLMPVVEKIESLGFQFFIHNEGAYIKKWFYRGNIPDLGSIQESKIKAAWELTTGFIQWYNNQTIQQ